MSDFRPGDKYIDVGGTRTRLRLSVSALAEIASVMEAGSPSDLAQRLRRAGASMGEREWNLILQAVASPRPIEALDEGKLTDILPTLSAVISEGLSP